MRFGAGITAHNIRRAAQVFVLALLFMSLSASHIARAESSNVQATINSGTIHPALELTGITSPVTVDAMPVQLTGNVESLTQVQVYVDGVYSVAIPLDAGATSFSYNLVVSAGPHSVKLVGISPFADLSPTVEIAVIYTPQQATPTETNNGPSSTTHAGTSTFTGGVIISHDTSSNTSTAPVETVQTSSLPTWLYNSLVAVDLLRKEDVNGTELVKTVQRVSLVTTGLFFFVFARPTLFLYRRVRYSWLGFRQRSVPDFLHRHPLGYIRVFGIALIGCVFSLI